MPSLRPLPGLPFAQPAFRPSQRTFILRRSTRSPKALRTFHTLPCRRRRSSSNYQSIPQSAVDRIAAERSRNLQASDDAVQHYEPYTEDEKAELAKKYSPAQLAAIEAGEAAISQHDLATQAKFRRDPLQFEYLDDFTRIEKTIDKKIEKLRSYSQDSEPIEGYTRLPNEFSTFVEAGRVQRQAEVEDVGGWVPVRPKGHGAGEQGHQGPLEKLELRRTAHQIAKAALKEYFATPTVQEAIDYCRTKDMESFEEAHRRFDAQLEGKEDPNALQRKDLPGLSLAPLPSNSDRPIISKFFEKEVLHDQRYKDILQRIKETPPPAKHFGTPEMDTKLREIFDPPMPDVAPEIPKINDPTVRWASSKDAAGEEDDGATTGLEDEALEAYRRLAKSMSQTIAQLRAYRVKTITTHRVVNQTRLGKISSIYFCCVAGNEKGMVGIGEGKAAESDEAARVARLNAIRNMVPILRYEERTIYGEVSGKVGAAEVKLSAGKPGFGLRTSQHIFEIARCAGLLDLSARVTRSRNPMNVAKAVWQALKSQKHPEDIARARGKKLVDVRKVYYSGLV